MSDQLSQNIIDQIRLTVRTEVKTALKEVINYIQNRDKHVDSIENEELLSSAQVAKFLKIKLRTVYAKCEKHELPFHRIGKRKLLFRKDEIMEYVNYRNVFKQNSVDSTSNTSDN
jgi:excisionase family DNA binding protein